MAVPEFLVEAIAQHLAENRGGQELDSSDLMFVRPGVLRRRFGERVPRPAVERAGLPPMTFHSLRHVAITAMAEAGIPYNVTPARVGHATARLTMELYSHRTTEGDREAAKALGEHFRGVVEETSHVAVVAEPGV